MESFEKNHQHVDDKELALDRKVGRMGMLLHRYYTANAKRHGAFGDPLRGQGRLLALLAVKPETTQRELSFLLDMRQQSLSELLAKLEEKGFVTREKSPEDGRVTVVKLTEAGAAAAPTADDMGGNGDALDCLTDEEREQLEQLTDKVVASLEEKLTALGIDPYAPPRSPRGDRDERGPRGDRGRRDDRADRGPRGERGPRGDRGPRDDDRPRFRGERGSRGPRSFDRDNDFRGPRGPRQKGERRGWDGNSGDHLHRA